MAIIIDESTRVLVQGITGREGAFHTAQMLEYGTARGLACHCLLTKADKLPRGQAARALKETRRAVAPGVAVQLFSATSHQGVDEARATLTGWLALGDAGA